MLAVKGGRRERPESAGREPMPPTQDRRLLPDSTAFGLSRRRVWAHPDLTSHSLLVLTFDRLYLAPLAGATPETRGAIESVADPDDVLGPLAVVIDLISVRRMKLDLLTNSLVLEYVGGGMGTSRQRVTFATPEAADACFTKVWRRVGDGLRLAPVRPAGWTLARAPLLVLLGTLIATGLLVLLMSIFEDAGPAGRAGLSSSSERVFDWQVVCGVGGIVAAASQVWLYRRLTTPPAALELVRE